MKIYRKRIILAVIACILFTFFDAWINSFRVDTENGMFFSETWINTNFIKYIASIVVVSFSIIFYCIGFNEIFKYLLNLVKIVKPKYKTRMKVVVAIFLLAIFIFMLIQLINVILPLFANIMYRKIGYDHYVVLGFEKFTTCFKCIFSADFILVDVLMSLIYIFLVQKRLIPCKRVALFVCPLFYSLIACVVYKIFSINFILPMEALGMCLMLIIFYKSVHKISKINRKYLIN